MTKIIVKEEVQIGDHVLEEGDSFEVLDEKLKLHPDITKLLQIDIKNWESSGLPPKKYGKELGSILRETIVNSFVGANDVFMAFDILSGIKSSL